MSEWLATCIADGCITETTANTIIKLSYLNNFLLGLLIALIAVIIAYAIKERYPLPSKMLLAFAAVVGLGCYLFGRFISGL